MQELIKFREQGNHFQLCCGKVIGERSGLNRNGLKEIYLLIFCDDWFGAHAADKFMKQVIMKVSIISSENFLFYSHQKIPRPLFDYYRKLVESWKKKELAYALKNK